MQEGLGLPEVGRCCGPWSHDRLKELARLLLGVLVLPAGEWGAWLLALGPLPASQSERNAASRPASSGNKYFITASRGGNAECIGDLLEEGQARPVPPTETQSTRNTRAKPRQSYKSRSRDVGDKPVWLDRGNGGGWVGTEGHVSLGEITVHSCRAWPAAREGRVHG